MGKEVPYPVGRSSGRRKEALYPGALRGNARHLEAIGFGAGGHYGNGPPLFSSLALLGDTTCAHTRRSTFRLCHCEQRGGVPFAASLSHLTSLAVWTAVLLRGEHCCSFAIRVREGLRPRRWLGWCSVVSRVVRRLLEFEEKKMAGSSHISGDLQYPVGNSPLL